MCLLHFIAIIIIDDMLMSKSNSNPGIVLLPPGVSPSGNEGFFIIISLYSFSIEKAFDFPAK